MANNYIMKLKLSNFLNSRVMEIENDDGVMEKGIFIPIDINGLYLSPRNQVFAWGFVSEKLHDTGDGYSHYIKMKTNMDHVSKINHLGYSVPYLGGMKISYIRSGYQKRAESLIDKKVKNI